MSTIPVEEELVVVPGTAEDAAFGTHAVGFAGEGAGTGQAFVVDDTALFVVVYWAWETLG